MIVEGKKGISDQKARCTVQLGSGWIRDKSNQIRAGLYHRGYDLVLDEPLRRRVHPRRRTQPQPSLDRLCSAAAPTCMGYKINTTFRG